MKKIRMIHENMKKIYENVKKTYKKNVKKITRFEYQLLDLKDLTGDYLAFGRLFGSWWPGFGIESPIFDRKLSQHNLFLS